MSPRALLDRITAGSAPTPSPTPSSSPLSSSDEVLMECVVKAQTCSVESVCTERDHARRMLKYATAITGSDFTSDPALTTSSTCRTGVPHRATPKKEP